MTIPSAPLSRSAVMSLTRAASTSRSPGGRCVSSMMGVVFSIRWDDLNHSLSAGPKIVCEADKLRGGELFGATLSQSTGQFNAPFAGPRPTAIAECLPPLIEGRAHDVAKKRRGAPARFRLLARESEANHGAHDIRPRKEYLGRDGEQELGIGENLRLYAQDAVSLRTRLGNQTLGHLLLHHQNGLFDHVTGIEQGNQDLARDVVGEVADHVERRRRLVRERAPVHLQDVLLPDVRVRQALPQVTYGTLVDFDGRETRILRG